MCVSFEESEEKRYLRGLGLFMRIILKCIIITPDGMDWIDMAQKRDY
jgi:hypothetical protein